MLGRTIELPKSGFAPRFTPRKPTQAAATSTAFSGRRRPSKPKLGDPEQPELPLSFT
jgi:hypothetical protein